MDCLASGAVFDKHRSGRIQRHFTSLWQFAMECKTRQITSHCFCCAWVASLEYDFDELARWMSFTQKRTEDSNLALHTLAINCVEISRAPQAGECICTVLETNNSLSATLGGRFYLT